MKPSEILSKRGAWTQGYYAKNRKGEKVMVRDSNACSWCALGAITKAYPYGHIADMIAVKLANHLGISQISIPDWNDNPKRKKREVIAAFQAIGE